ncbi:hypothetical protein GCM10027299_21910 [Larkinella ripae]
MKDPSIAVRTAYRALLNNMTVSGKQIKLYVSMAPSGAEPPYLILKSQQTLPDSTKTSFGAEHLVTLAAVTRWTGNLIDKEPAELIANEAMAKLMPEPGKVGLAQQPGFHIYTATLETAQELSLDTKSGTDFQKLITFKHLIQEV